MSRDLLRPGGEPHYCDQPRLDLKIRNGAIWRCPLWTPLDHPPNRTNWQLILARALGPRYRWPWPRRKP